MSRYFLLVLLNAPFVFYGMFKAVLSFKEGTYSKSQLCLRIAFWGACLAVLILAKPMYDLLRGDRLTDSPPPSLADVLLTTVSFLSLTMIIRLYARLEQTEKKLTELNEALALKQSSLD